MKLLLVDDDCAALYALSEVLSDVPAAAIRSLERLRRTPIIFMSAHEDRRRKPRSGAADAHYFRKPLVPELVRAKVMALLAALPQTVDSHLEETHGQHDRLG